MLGIMYISYNSNALIMNITDNASSINDFITKIYYPAGAYIELVTNFNPIKLLEFIVVNVCLFVITTMVMGKVYFNINSGVKAINLKKSNKKYTIKSTTPTRTLIKKELNRFVNSPVFITNAGFGLVLFILGCVLITVKFDSLAEIITKSDAGITLDYIKSYMPTILFGFICLTSFMTSITSSMISLEGKSFELLKSLPLKPYKIVRAKVLTAILIMLPCIIIGDAIIFIRFGFDLLSIVFILIASILLPLCAETLGIIINLKYPRMDAKNDTEVVKQSSSSAISVFLGMAIIGITVAILFNAVGANISNSMIMLILIISYVAVYFLMEMALRKICGECFDNIG